jgi:hypothetical protein
MLSHKRRQRLRDQPRQSTERNDKTLFNQPSPPSTAACLDVDMWGLLASVGAREANNRGTETRRVSPWLRTTFWEIRSSSFCLASAQKPSESVESNVSSGRRPSESVESNVRSGRRPSESVESNVSRSNTHLVENTSGIHEPRQNTHGTLNDVVHLELHSISIRRTKLPPTISRGGSAPIPNVSHHPSRPYNPNHATSAHKHHTSQTLHITHLNPYTSHYLRPYTSHISALTDHTISALKHHTILDLTHHTSQPLHTTPSRPLNITHLRPYTSHISGLTNHTTSDLKHHTSQTLHITPS